MMMRPRHRLQLMMTMAGTFFVWSVIQTPSFRFALLPKAFPTDFRQRQGFFHVLRWLEQLDEPDTLAVFLAAVAAFHARPPGTDESSPVLRTADALLAHVRRVVTWETYVFTSKMALQWGLLVFLSRAKAASTRVAISCVCLSILSLICAKMAQSCLVEMLVQAMIPSTIGEAKQKDRAAFIAVFLGLLFWVRFAATAIVSGVVARAYQSFFGGWPPARWRDVPRYIGSKDFALSTLFYGVAGASIIAISSRSLRSLAEAAYHIESVAMAAAFIHFLVHELGLTADVAPVTTATVEKSKQA